MMLQVRTEYVSNVLTGKVSHVLVTHLCRAELVEVWERMLGSGSVFGIFYQAQVTVTLWRNGPRVSAGALNQG